MHQHISMLLQVRVYMSLGTH